MSYISSHFSNQSESQLLETYDDPKNFHIPDHRNKLTELDKNSFPEHATILLTHGLFSINSLKRREIIDFIWETREKVYRLFRNFSDWWTRKVLKKSFIPEENIIIPDSSRLEWDPARAIDAKDIVRKDDFNENKLLPEETLKELQSTWSSWKTNHVKYHTNIIKKLSHVEKSIWGSVTFDIHDTWVRMMKLDSKNDSFREWGYPKMEIWTCEWMSCNQEILDFFITQVEKYFGFTPVVNEKYKWGYVTQKHGRDYRKQLEEKWEDPRQRNVIQIELWRYLYMKESTQQIDWEQAEKVGAALRLCIQKTAEEFWEEYFSNL